MKLTPLLLFFMILLVLVVSAIFMNNLRNEGFIDFNLTGVSGGTMVGNVSVPLYSTNYKLTKLYDNIYLDTRNANLVALDGPSSGTASMDPSTLSTISVLTRNPNAYNSIVLYSNSQNVINNYDCPESKNSSIATSYQLLTIHTNQPNDYQVFYFAWNKDTYVHVIDISGRKHAVSYYINSTSNITAYDLSANGPTHVYPPLTISNSSADLSDNLTQTITLYDPTTPLYQLHTYVFYDNIRGYVVCTDTNKAIKNIYDYLGNDLYNAATNAASAILNNPPSSTLRISTIVSSKTQFASVNTFTSTVLSVNATNVAANAKNVLILSNNVNKILAYISANANGLPVITNYMKFNGATIDTTVSTPTPTPTGNRQRDASGGSLPSPIAGVPLDSATVTSEYMKWYTYWNSVGQPGNKGFSDDYLLKTQIVPPVCPACNTVGGCSNCNGGGSSYGGAGASGTGSGSGSGGSGTGTGTGASAGDTGTVIAHADDKHESVIATTGKNITTVDRGGALASTADPDTLGGSLTLGQLSFVAGLQDVGHVVGDTADNAVNKVGQGIGAIGQGIGSAGSGIYNTINNAGQGIYSAGQGIGGAVQNTGSYLGGALNSVGSTAYEAGKYVGTGIGNGIKKIGDEIDERDDRYKRGSYSGSNSNIINNGNINGTGYKDNYYDPSRQAYNNSYRGATTNAPGQYTGTDIDQYSYYGALQSKGGNFMPLTSDFSKFGR
jgi:hypothetical protein